MLSGTIGEGGNSIHFDDISKDLAIFQEEKIGSIPELIVNNIDKVSKSCNANYCHYILDDESHTITRISSENSYFLSSILTDAESIRKSASLGARLDLQ